MGARSRPRRGSHGQERLGVAQRPPADQRRPRRPGAGAVGELGPARRLRGRCLITGAAGFIGANFLKYILKKYEDINVIVVDSLTYAGNLGTIKEELKDSRVKFEKVDILYPRTWGFRPRRPHRHSLSLPRCAGC